MRRLRKYFALTPAGRSIVLRSLLLLPLVAGLLRVRGMAGASALLGRLERRTERRDGTPAAQEIARLVDAAASFLGAQCLSRSLVLCHLLRSRGLPAEIRLGVSTPGDGKLIAHAWVELDGLPLNDGADVSRRYAALRTAAIQSQGGRP